MKSIATVNPYRLGLVAIAVLGLLCGLVVLLSVVSFGTSTYTAQLEHTAGLRAGEDVQIAGVSVGEVKSVELQGDLVVATFTVDDGIDLGVDTTASVRVATLLGTHFLKIDPKGPGSLTDGQIPLANTDVPFNLQDVLEQGGAALEELDADALAAAFTAASGALEAGSDDLRPALRGVERVSAVVATRMNQAGDLLQAARDVSDQLAGSTEDIIGLMKQSQLVLDEIVRRREVLHELLVDATALARSLQAITTSADEQIAPVLRDLNITLEMLKAQRDGLQEAFRVIAPTVRYLANATGNGPWIDVYAPSVVSDAAQCETGDC